MTTTTTINGGIFIIPNSIEVWNEDSEVADFRRDFFYQPEQGQKYVQVWMYSDELGCDNLSCHTSKLDGMFSEHYIAPDYVPVSLFEGKEDGDVIEISLPNQTFVSRDGRKESYDINLSLTINQAENRYNRFGSVSSLLGNLRVARMA